MTDDLSALPQPVREAIETLNANARYMLSTLEKQIYCEQSWSPALRIVVVELLRLYAENSANVKSLNMLYGEKFSDRTYAALKSRVEHAETELAKLRARIANAPSLTVSRDAGDASIYGYGLIPETMKGQRVRIVVEE